MIIELTPDQVEDIVLKSLVMQNKIPSGMKVYPSFQMDIENVGFATDPIVGVAFKGMMINVPEDQESKTGSRIFKLTES